MCSVSVPGGLQVGQPSPKGSSPRAGESAAITDAVKRPIKPKLDGSSSSSADSADESVRRHHFSFWVLMTKMLRLVIGQR